MATQFQTNSEKIKNLEKLLNIEAALKEVTELAETNTQVLVDLDHDFFHDAVRLNKEYAEILSTLCTKRFKAELRIEQLNQHWKVMGD